MTLPFPDSPYGYSTNTTIAQCNLTVAKQAGFTTVRRIMSWSNLEPTSGNFDAPTLAQLDTEVQLAFSNGLNFTLCMDTPPSWAQSVYHNGCTNMDATAVLNLWQTLLNRYNGGTVSNALIAACEFANEGYDDIGLGNTCQSFENVTPVLQQLYPWIKANYPNVLVGTPAHFNHQQSDINSVQGSLYTGFYGNAKGLFDYSNFHGYVDVRSNNIYTGPDGPQSNSADTFAQIITDLHAVDVANSNGSVPIYCTETGISVPGSSNQNTEVDHTCFFVGGQGTTGVYEDMLNNNNLTHIYIWTIQNSNGYSISQGCGSITYLPSFYAIKGFIAANPLITSSLTAKKAAMFAL